MALRLALCLCALSICAWQPGVNHALSIGHVAPDFALLLIMSAGMLLGPEDGALLGFVCGLFQASQAGVSGLGALMISRIALGAASGYLGTRVFGANLAVPGLCALVATLVAEACHLLISPYPNFGLWTKIVLGEAVYNAAVALPIYRLVAYLVGRLAPRPVTPL